MLVQKLKVNKVEKEGENSERRSVMEYAVSVKGRVERYGGKERGRKESWKEVTTHPRQQSNDRKGCK
jgi:hypothetical protein